MSAVAVAIGGSALLGAYTADRAGKRQSDAANAASDRTAQAGIQARADLAPWRDSGQLANAKLMELLGLSTPGASMPTREQFTSTTPASSAVYEPGQWDRGGQMRGRMISPGNPGGTRFDQAGYDNAMAGYQKSASAQKPDDYGSLLHNFTGADLQNEPGYKFGMEQGQQAIDRAASAAGRYDSGQTLKELTRYGQDYAGTKYDNAFNRDAANKSRVFGYLSGQSGQGANAAGQQAGIGMNTASGVGNFQTQGADASAAGMVGAANAIGGGVGNYLGYQSNLSTLNYLKGLRGGGSGNGWNQPSAGYGAQG